MQDLKQVPEPSEVLCRMSLDVDGILHVTAIEKCTGKSKHISVDRALEKKTDAEIAEAREKLETLYSRRVPEEPKAEEVENLEAAPETLVAGDSLVSATGAWAELSRKASDLVERSRHAIEQLHDEDREEMVDLNQEIENAMAAKDEMKLEDATNQLSELLFFVEGR